MWFEDGKSWIEVVIVVKRTKLGRKLNYGRWEMILLLYLSLNLHAHKGRLVYLMSLYKIHPGKVTRDLFLSFSAHITLFFW
jgi:hypothetical protein